MGRKSAFDLDVVSVRLVRDAPIASSSPICSPEDAIHLVGQTLCDMDREMVCVINLKSDGTPINCNFASMGALDYAMVHPREIMKASILSNAAQIILVHNHPSGTLLPSKSDVQMTAKMQKVMELVDIPLLDHVIVGGDNRKYFSFKDKGLVEKPKMYFPTDYHHLDWDKSAIADRGVKR